MKKLKEKMKRVLAMALALLVVLGPGLQEEIVVQAADGTITFTAGDMIGYGDYYTSRMTFDGDNTAYCVEPMRKTPDAGTYSYNLLGNSSPVRKALYYLYGGYGYNDNVKSHFSGWSNDDIYVVSHLVAAYVYANYADGDEVFYGATQRYIDKTKEISNVISSLPVPPTSFKAFIVPGSGEQSIVGSWYSQPGWIELTKSSANTSITDRNGNYSLEGAQYGIYQGSTLVETLTTDAKGYAKSDELEVGSYTIKEIKASKGYSLDVKSYQVSVTDNTTSSLDVKEIPQNNPITIVLQKQDSETDENVAQGSGSLEGAEFTIKYFTEQMDGNPESSGKTAERSWVFKTDNEGTIRFASDYLVSGDDFYYQADETTICLPLGTITIQEIKAPGGYLINNEVFTQKITATGTEETIAVYQTVTVKEEIIRGDLEFIKVSDGNLNRLANVPFKITSKTTGESHIIVTDKNGYASTASSWNPHSSNANRGETSEDGIWFGSGAVNDKKGALLYDEYNIQELRSSSNEGYGLLNFDITVYKDMVTIPLGTLTNDEISIGTTARDSETDTNISKPDEKVTIIDTVSYEGLTKGETYTIKGILMDQGTGEPLLVDEQEVTAETTFTAKSAKGSVEVSFTFDGSFLQGKIVVVFEELYYEDFLLAVHADIEDTDQTIYFPKIGTTAKDGADGDKKILTEKKVTIVDTVAFENLIVGKKYKVTGILMSKETGEPLLINDKEVTAEATFVPETTSGTVDVTFQFDGRELAGQEVVVFETLYLVNGRVESEIASHEDIEDEGQTVSFYEEKEEEPETPESPSTPSTPIKTTGKGPKTGDGTKALLFAALLACSASGVGLHFYRKRKKNRKPTIETDVTK